MKSMICINLNYGAVFNHGELFKAYENISNVEFEYKPSGDLIRIYYTIYDSLRQEFVTECDEYDFDEYDLYGTIASAD